MDAGFRGSLLLRGRVPAGATAAAHSLYREHLEAERFTLYGRVVRDAGYVCLQYWFFYAMNDWRSTFHGINDHEADRTGSWSPSIWRSAPASGHAP